MWFLFHSAMMVHIPQVKLLEWEVSPTSPLSHKVPHLGRSSRPIPPDLLCWTVYPSTRGQSLGLRGHGMNLRPRPAVRQGALPPPGAGRPPGRVPVSRPRLVLEPATPPPREGLQRSGFSPFTFSFESLQSPPDQCGFCSAPQ